MRCPCQLLQNSARFKRASLKQGADARAALENRILDANMIQPNYAWCPGECKEQIAPQVPALGLRKGLKSDASQACPLQARHSRHCLHAPTLWRGPHPLRNLAKSPCCGVLWPCCGQQIQNPPEPSSARSLPLLASPCISDTYERG